MMLTKDGLDGWLVKGFDGLAEHFLRRANQGNVPDEMIESLKRLVDILQRVLNCKQGESTQNLDPLIAKAARDMGTLLMWRAMESGLGEIGPFEKTRLHEYMLRYEQALSRLQENKDGSRTT